MVADEAADSHRSWRVTGTILLTLALLGMTARLAVLCWEMR